MCWAKAVSAKCWKKRLRSLVCKRIFCCLERWKIRIHIMCRQIFMCMQHALRKSIAIQEAQILGCPVIASDCNGNREQIENGIDGILCSLTPEAIADSIKELIADPKKREKYAKRAQNRNTQNKDELDLLLKMTK